VSSTSFTVPVTLSCSGSCECLDTDGDGTCDVEEVAGCMDATACNVDTSATDVDDFLCEYPSSVLRDCADNCIEDTDGDGVCDKEEAAPEESDPCAADCADTNADGILENEAGCEVCRQDNTGNNDQNNQDGNQPADPCAADCADTNGDGILESVAGCEVCRQDSTGNDDQNHQGDVCADANPNIAVLPLPIPSPPPQGGMIML
jgi:hypothetical protein